MRVALGTLLIAVGGVRAEPAESCIAPSAPVDAGALLGLVRTVNVDVNVYFGDALVAYGSTSFEVSTRVMRPDLSNIKLHPTNNSISGVRSATLRVEATFLPDGAVAADDSKTNAANTLCECFENCQTPTTVFDADTYSAFYSTAFWSPSVDASGNTEIITGGCPVAGTSSDASAVEAVAAACYPINPGLEKCRKLRRCTALEYESNANVRSKHIDVECETISQCDENSQYEVVAPTPSTDRLCAEKVEHCFIDAGEVALPGTTPVSTCVEVKPCSDEEYTDAGATADNQPVCVPYQECKDGEFQVQPRTRQSNLLCSSVSPVCSRSGEAPRRTTLDDGEVPALPESFETAAPTATTDRVCTATTVCNPGDLLVSQASVTSDRTCGAAPEPKPTGAPSPPSPPPAGMPALIWGIVTTALAGVWVAVTTSRSSLPNWWD